MTARMAPCGIRRASWAMITAVERRATALGVECEWGWIVSSRATHNIGTRPVFKLLILRTLRGMVCKARPWAAGPNLHFSC